MNRNKHFWRHSFVYSRFVCFVWVSFWFVFDCNIFLFWFFFFLRCVLSLFIWFSILVFVCVCKFVCKRHFVFGCKALNRTNLVENQKNHGFCVFVYVCMCSIDLCLSNHQKEFVVFASLFTLLIDDRVCFYISRRIFKMQIVYSAKRYEKTKKNQLQSDRKVEGEQVEIEDKVAKRKKKKQIFCICNKRF